MVVSIYSPLALTGATLDGRDLTMVRSREAGYSVYSARITIPAASTSVLTVDLEGGLDLADGSYRLEVGPQPMVNDGDVTAEVADGWQLGGPSSVVEDGGRVLSMDVAVRRR